MNHPSKHQHNYNVCTWAIAVLLALTLLWMLLTGRGPLVACCEEPLQTPAPVAEVATELGPSDETFSFTATLSDFTSHGDASRVAWLTNKDQLNVILSGEDLRLQGDEKNILLSGIVDTDAIKQEKGMQAQAFFGPDVVFDNQLVIKAGR